MRTPKILLAALLVCGGATPPATRAAETNAPAWLTQPLSLAGAIDIALRSNGAILRGQSDLEAQYGVVVQTRAIAIPKLQATGNYDYTTETEVFPFPGFKPINHNWNGGVQLTQTIYQGGQINSSLRTAKLTKEQALLQYQTVIADNLLLVRVAYYDVLQAIEQVGVEEASLNLLAQELDDQKRRFEAGMVPRFNVLRAEVEHGNQKPRLISARNALRIAKSNLVNLLGSSLPPQSWEDIPLRLTDKLDAEPWAIELAAAIGQALHSRPELAVLRKQEALRKEGLVVAESGNKPTVQLYGGYGARNSQFIADPGIAVNGATAGAQVTWSLFDGFLTRGKIAQAKAQFAGSKVDVENESRNIELEVRTDFSNFVEARETLESQTKVVEEAEEALRLAKARSEAGTGTQLDVLSAQTSLTQARSTRVRALHDYDATRARLEHAMGVNILQTAKP